RNPSLFRLPSSSQDTEKPSFVGAAPPRGPRAVLSSPHHLPLPTTSSHPSLLLFPSSRQNHKVTLFNKAHPLRAGALGSLPRRSSSLFFTRDGILSTLFFTRQSSSLRASHRQRRPSSLHRLFIVLSCCQFCA
ncbi:hypothetical protein PIB30_067102, partial [Stylosanthes scabra]|nr:hypothetical protein [Stylosanthes scabra]